MDIPKKKTIRFLLWAFVLGWMLQIGASFFARRGQAAPYQLLLIVTMFAPLAATLLAGIPLKGMGWRPRLRGMAQHWLAAWLAPAALTMLGALLYFLLFPRRLDLSGAYLTAALGADALEQLAAQGLSYPTYVAVSALQALTFAPFLNALAAMGEETGWRGVLYPWLKARFGAGKGRLLGGLIWGVWHWPIIVLAGYEYGSAYFGAPVLAPLLFCIFAVSVGVLLEVLYEKTGCIWAPALAHGAVNAAAGVPILFLAPRYADQLILGPVPVGVIAGIPFLITALLLGRKQKEVL